MNSLIVCNPARRCSLSSSMRRCTSSKYAALAEKRACVLAYRLSTRPASWVSWRSSSGSRSRSALRISAAICARSRSASASVAPTWRAAGSPSSAIIR